MAWDLPGATLRAKAVPARATPHRTRVSRAMAGSSSRLTTLEVGSTLVRHLTTSSPRRIGFTSSCSPGGDDVNVAPTGPPLTPMRDEHPAAGKQIGRFQLVHFLGSGGTGDVWLAEDTLLGRRVALKLPHPHLVSAAKIRREFLREARAGSMLDHPGIATIYDAGDSPCGPYIAMAF